MKKLLFINFLTISLFGFKSHSIYFSSFLKSKDTCETELEGKFKDPEKYLMPDDKLVADYPVVVDLRGVSKSGAFPAIVKKSDGKKMFLKIFPVYKKGDSLKKNQTYLEMLLSCRLARMTEDAHLPGQMTAKKFFVDFYDAGFLRSADPYAKRETDSNRYYPYLLGEAVDGPTMTKLATEDGAKARASLGYDLYSAPPKVLESILMQIIIALGNAFLANGITHNDLHTGNIILAAKEKADFMVYQKGKAIQLRGPLVKIIDFGLGESKDYKQKLNLWIEGRPFILELEKFIKAARGDENIPISSRIAMQAASKNQDILMFNLLIRGLKPVLEARGNLVPDGKYCKDYEDCIDFVAKWWK